MPESGYLKRLDCLLGYIKREGIFSKGVIECAKTKLFKGEAKVFPLVFV